MKTKPYKDKEQEVFVVFNKLSGAHMSQRVGGTEKNIDTTYFKFKTVFFNPCTHRWVGDFDDGELMAIGELNSKTDELSLDVQCAKKIAKRVKVYHQLNAYSDMFKALIDKGILTEADPGVKEFLAQREYIEKILSNNAMYKEARANSPHEKYLSKADLDKKKNDQNAGGLNVVVGRGK